MRRVTRHFLRTPISGLMDLIASDTSNDSQTGHKKQASALRIMDTWHCPNYHSCSSLYIAARHKPAQDNADRHIMATSPAASFAHALDMRQLMTPSTLLHGPGDAQPVTGSAPTSL